jgi:hypothetical protein
VVDEVVDDRLDVAGGDHAPVGGHLAAHVQEGGEEEAFLAGEVAEDGLHGDTGALGDRGEGHLVVKELFEGDLDRVQDRFPGCLGRARPSLHPVLALGRWALRGPFAAHRDKGIRPTRP